jgi:hypothetical protein
MVWIIAAGHFAERGSDQFVSFVIVSYQSFAPFQ